MKIINECMSEDLSQPHIIKTWDFKEVEVCFYNPEYDSDGNETEGAEIKIGEKIYSLEEAQKLKKLFNEYL